MKKFTSFLKRNTPFVNMHGSHAGFRSLNEEADGAEIFKSLSSAAHEINNPKPPVIHEEWHDGTPEGKRHLDFLKTTYNKHGKNAFVSHYVSAHEDHHLSPHVGDIGGIHYEGHSYRVHRQITAMHNYNHMDGNHIAAVRDYTSSSGTLNHALARGEEITGSLRSMANGLDHSIGRITHSLSGSLTTYHGTMFDVSAHLQSGNPTLHSKGYLSSSTHTKVAHSFGDNVMVLNAPHHHTSMPVKDEHGTFTHEREVIHPRGMVLRPRAALKIPSPRYGIGYLKMIPTDIEDVKPTSLDGEK